MIRSRTDWREACTAAGGGTSEELEKRFAEWVGRKYAIATAGGGPSLHIACLAAGVGLGHEVITTPYSWGQTVSCILQAGGIPVFADIHPETLTIDPANIEALISARTKAIVVCNIYGIPAELDAICAIAKKHGLRVIEDCAQAQGSLYKGRQVGSFGDFGCFSIGSGKNLAAGDGGVLVCEDRRLYELALLAGMHPGRNGREVESPDLKEWVDSLIFTYRINAFTAALALEQMNRVDETNGWRRKNIARLREGLRGVPGIRPLDLPERDPAWHICMWTFVGEDLPGVTRGQYVKALQAEGVPIGTGYVGTPINLRRTFQKKEWWLGNGYPWAATERGKAMVYAEGDCPVAERRCRELDMNLGGGGWWQDLSEMVDQIVEAFRKVTAEPGRLGTIEA
ncbi:MAG: DegT/DnrJ/EryC1/StrS family aminotransferase [Armatimonadetes bacterium]|nr:DegT/DnrJ/EryC1/StrS family aminotransferase [Armatimonadota bacterium]